MNTISSINNSTSSGQNSLTSSDQNTLGKEEFLTLLVSQLQNQDPLNPSDPTEFVSQLAEFSSLEQLMNVNENLEVIQGYQDSLNRSVATSLFGKTIVATGNAIELEGNQSTTISFNLPEAADKGAVNIYDSAGNFVMALEPDDWGAGEHNLEWDGTDSNGDSFPSGVYLFDVQAVDAEGNAIKSETYIEGEVTGAKYMNGNVYLTLNETIVPLSSVIEVMGPQEETEETDSE